MAVLVVINPISGPGPNDLAARVRRRSELARAVLDREGLAGRVVVTEGPGHAEALARAAGADGVSRVVAWGGDGTTNEVGRALAFGSIPLGIVPCGSGNGLARALGLPRRADAAYVRALRGGPVRVDAGELAGRLFFNVAGIGFDAHVARRFNRLGLRRGFFAYLRVGLGALFEYVPRSYEIRLADRLVAGPALMVVVANGPEFGNAARIAPNARVDDGLLDVVIVAPATPWRDVLRARYLYDGSVPRRPGFITARLAAATISAATGSLLCHVDGEPFDADGPIRACVHPGALQVIR
jgi:YegS/Rv2252/BmrU family lipid kinase